MDTRTRWVVGILIALVIGLGVALIIVAADNSGNDNTISSSSTLSTPTRTQSTTTQATTTTSTAPNGGTGVPTDTAPGGTGGL
jgi:hypothetical protein